MPDGGGDGYQVNPDDLTTHANTVRRIASTLDQALAAAEQVTMGVQAYGLICGPLFVPMVLAVSAPGLVTLGLSAKAMDSVADGIGETAADYSTIENSHVRTMKNIGSEDLR